MTPETTAILVAIITLGSSLVSFSLASIINVIENNKKREWQKEDDDKKRNWEIEDRKFQRRLDVLNARLNESKEYINQEYDVASKLTYYEAKLIFFDGTNKNDIEFEEMSQLLADATKKGVSINNLNDEELMKQGKILVSSIKKEVAAATILRKKYVEKVHIDKESELTRIGNFHIEVGLIRQLMMKRIDELSGFEN